MNIDLLIKLYDHFVHYHMYKVFKQELCIPRSMQVLSSTNPQYQSRLWVYYYYLYFLIWLKFYDS